MSETVTDAPLVRMTAISKRFGRVQVLFGVDFEITAGEVHILAGENGAGKTTLIKILSGVHTDFTGTVELAGTPVKPRSPQEALALGVAVIHQELSLVPSMSVADNIFLGRFPTRCGFVSRGRQGVEAQRLLDQFGIDVDANRLVETLPIATQQLVEIAKALSRRAKSTGWTSHQSVVADKLACQAGPTVMVMDEPTSALREPEVQQLFSLIRDLRCRGCGIVYITHKMEEIERVADRITVLRDGRLVGTAPAAELPTAKLIRWMVGRDMTQQFPRPAGKPVPEDRWENRSHRVGWKTGRTGQVGEPVPHRLRIEGFTVVTGGGATGWTSRHSAVADKLAGQADPPRPVVDGVSLSVRGGEILGVVGLQGSGNTELLMGLFGAYGRHVTGRVWLDGKPVVIRSPRWAIDNRIALLTNDRKTTGLILSLSVIANTTLAALARLSPGGWRRPGREREATRRLAESLQLRGASLEMEVNELSGGNQQKVVLAKLLATGPRLMLLDEPTRGVDIGAKREIYRLINEWTGQGIAIMLISSEMPELLALSDQIVVMHRGRLTARLSREQASAEVVLAAAMGKEQAKVNS